MTEQAKSRSPGDPRLVKLGDVRLHFTATEVRLIPGEGTEAILTFDRDQASILVDELLDWIQPHQTEKPKLWGIGAIARHYKVTIPAVRKWRRHFAFPEPTTKLGHQLVWEQAAVKRWVKLYRKPPGPRPKGAGEPVKARANK